MTHRITLSALLLTATVGGLIAIALPGAPTVNACQPGQLEDVVTRMCWSQTGQGESYGGPGDGPCLPGRIGSCLGSLQRGPSGFIPVPGAVTDW